MPSAGRSVTVPVGMETGPSGRLEAARSQPMREDDQRLDRREARADADARAGAEREILEAMKLFDRFGSS